MAGKTTATKTKQKSTTTKTKTTGSSTANTNKKTANTNQRGNTGTKSQDAMLQKFFLDCIKDVYWAEKHLTKALPKMRKAATSEELQTAFADHLAVTETHVERLEQVFAELGETARGKKCEAMEGLVKEGQSIIEDTEAGTATRDVGLILAAQKVEHYEIASYGGLAQLARTLGEDSVADIFESILSEEKEADMLLTEIAENDINYEASTEG